MAVAAVLGTPVLAEARGVRLGTSETYDEPIYLRVAYRVVRCCDFRAMAGPMSPPLPLLLGYWLPAIHEPRTPGWAAEAPALVARVRLMTAATVGIPLVLVVFAWLARRRGLWAGALGGVLMACSPTILASASIATTDACFALFAVLALAAIRRYQERPTTNTFLAMGGALGAALASKQSALALLPVAAVELFLARPGRGVAGDPGASRAGRIARDGAWWASRFAGLLAVALLADWALHGFGVARFGARDTRCPTPALLVWALNLAFDPDVAAAIVEHTGMPLALDTIIGQLRHARLGHPA